MKEVYGLLKNNDEREAIRSLVHARFSKTNSMVETPNGAQSPIDDAQGSFEVVSSKIPSESFNESKQR